MNPLALVAYCGCALIWGTTYYAIRVCIAPGGYPTYLAAALRFAIAAVILGCLVAAGWARPAPRGRRALVALSIGGVLNFLSYTLVYTAEERIPGGLAAVIFGTLPLVTAVVAAVSGTERPTSSAVVGAIVSLGGIALISLDRLEVSAPEAIGCLMVFGAVVCASCSNTLLKRETAGQHPLASNAVFLAVTAALMGALAAAAGRPAPWPPPPGPTLAVLYLAVIGSVVAFAGYFYLLQHVRLMTISTLVLVQPVVALTVDALFEAQRIAPRTYLGAGITLLGVAMNLIGRVKSMSAPRS